eukprot:TRINITY_DN8656_c0_g1_i2.p1 TRINITY_DN8656_c0_g1~~TRINITY_DN8656_c0_g1_i2.p1  ORF type:complete len:707 (-),score=148.72 TRINITY_DN8656_c0_g1_i2:36-2156(-)
MGRGVARIQQQSNSAARRKKKKDQIRKPGMLDREVPIPVDVVVSGFLQGEHVEKELDGLTTLSQLRDLQAKADQKLVPGKGVHLELFLLGENGKRTAMTNWDATFQELGIRDGDHVEVTEAIVDAWWFSASIYALIGVNALIMGLELEFTYGAWPTVWMVFEHFFTAAFLIEMIMKMYVLGLRRKCPEDAPLYFDDNWNRLDCFIVCTSVLDSWILAPVPKGEGFAIFLKMCGFLRLLRLLKVLKMKRELITLIEGIISSIGSMGWISMLLGVVIYTYAIFLTEMVRMNESAYPVVYVQTYWKDMMTSIVTLINISILDEWGDVVRPIMQAQIYLLPFLFVFLLLTTFSLMNAIIGIIVEKTTSAANDIAAQDDARMREEQVSMVKRLVKQILAMEGEGGDGLISYDEMDAFQKIAQAAVGLMSEIDKMTELEEEDDENTKNTVLADLCAKRSIPYEGSTDLIIGKLTAEYVRIMQEICEAEESVQKTDPSKNMSNKSVDPNSLKGLMERMALVSRVHEYKFFLQIITHINLPSGFQLTDIHAMLDTDGSGLITRDQFIHGMEGLINHSPFSEMCINQLAMGWIRHMAYDIEEAQKETERKVKRMKLELLQIRDHLGYPKPVLKQEAQPVEEGVEEGVEEIMQEEDGVRLAETDFQNDQNATENEFAPRASNKEDFISAEAEAPSESPVASQEVKKVKRKNKSDSK